VILSNMLDSVPPQRTGHRPLDRPERVDSVDECAFFVPRPVFDRIGFDERVCDGWHLYAVEFALSARTAGLSAYALPLPIYHRSGGAVVRVLGFATLEQAYFRALGRVMQKHGGRYDRIVTTCGAWSTQRSLLLQRFPPRAVAQAVRGWARGRLARPS
jgi:hypothetical protein